MTEALARRSGGWGRLLGVVASVVGAHSLAATASAEAREPLFRLHFRGGVGVHRGVFSAPGETVVRNLAASIREEYGRGFRGFGAAAEVALGLARERFVVALEGQLDSTPERYGSEREEFVLPRAESRLRRVAIGQVSELRFLSGALFGFSWGFSRLLPGKCCTGQSEYGQASSGVPADTPLSWVPYLSVKGGYEIPLFGNWSTRVALQGNLMRTDPTSEAYLHRNARLLLGVVLN